MKRKILEDLGLDDEIVNKIMAENGKDLTELKAKIEMDFVMECNYSQDVLRNS